MVTTTRFDLCLKQIISIIHTLVCGKGNLFAPLRVHFRCALNFDIGRVLVSVGRKLSNKLASKLF